MYRKDAITTSKPTYYLWRNDFSTQEKYEAVKDYFTRIGFRVVTYYDGQEEKNIHIAIKMLIKNHWKEIL